MSVSARLQIDWSKSFHISVRKPQFWPPEADFHEKLSRSSPNSHEYIRYYRFFCAEFKSDKCQLEKFEHFCRFKVKGQSQGQL